MKRIISFIIAAVFIFSLFACSDDTEEQIDTYIHTHYDEIYEAICAADDVSDVSDYILAARNIDIFDCLVDRKDGL